MNARPIKVVQVINTLQIGGAENFVRLLAGRLDRRRFTPIVVAIQGGGPYEQELIREGVLVKVMNRPRRSILLFPLFLKDVLTAVWDLYRFLKKVNPHILQTHLPASEYLGLLVGRWAGIPHLIYTVHSSNSLPNRSGKSLRTWARLKLTQFLLGQVQKVVAVSKAIGENLKGISPKSALDMRIIPNGIEVLRYKNILPDGSLKRTLGMAPADPLITLVGSLRPVKNQTMLLYAAARMIHRYPNLRIILVGEGLYKATLLDLMEKLGLTPYVHLLGLRRDIPEILSETDIFVSTSRWEGLPLSILEAMAAGKPIVATAVPGVSEVLGENAGVLVPLDDVESLTEILITLIEDPKARGKLGKQAQQRVSALFSLETCVEQWEALYEELMVGEH
jgi:glycosyltransferase involved in cell wall biosynthesis